MINANQLYQLFAPDVKLGQRVQIYPFTNLKRCEIGDDAGMGTFVKIQKRARLGARCKISSHPYVCKGGTLEALGFKGQIDHICDFLLTYAGALDLFFVQRLMTQYPRVRLARRNIGGEMDCIREC